MTTGINGAAYQNKAASDGSSSNNTKVTDPLASKDTFLQLLVAQLRNQNPLQPQDGVQFLSQLAQFSSVEQTIGIRDEVTKIRTALEALAQNQSESSKP